MLLAKAIFQTQKDNLHYLTATPMLNYLKDLQGFLFQFFKPEQSLPDMALGYLEQYVKGFDPEHAPEGGSLNDSLTYCNLMLPQSAETSTLQDAIEQGLSIYLLDHKQYLACSQSQS